MTQIKLWQIAKSQTGGSLLITDQNGNAHYLPSPQNIDHPVLVLSAAGMPAWVENEALATALQASQEAASALTHANAYTDTQLAALRDGAPVALDTLKELATKLAQEDSALAALILQLDQKADKTYVDALNAAALSTMQQKADAAQNNAISQAAADATTKANAAQTAALAQAASDATAKANAAQAAAIDAAVNEILAKSFKYNTQRTALYAGTVDLSATKNLNVATDLTLNANPTDMPLMGDAVSKVTHCFINGVRASEGVDYTVTAATYPAIQLEFSNDLALNNAVDASVPIVVVVQQEIIANCTIV